MASQSSLDTWQVRFDGGAWEEASGRLVSGGFFQVLGVSPAIGRVFTTADDRAETPSRRHQLQLLAATLRRPSRRARQDLHGAQGGVDHHRCRAARLHRRNQRAAAGPLAPAATAAPRAARPRSAARYASREGDVAPCVRTTETGRDAGAGGSPGQRDLSGRPGIVLWRRRVRGAPPRASGSASPSPAGRRVARRRRARNSPSR